MPSLTLVADRKAALTKARKIIDAARDEGRDELTPAEAATVKGQLAEVDEIDVRLKASDTADPFAQFAPPPGTITPASSESGAAFGLAPLGVSAKSAETLFKAAQDRQPVATKADTSTITPAQYPMQYLPPVSAAREPQRVLSLIPQQNMSSGSVTYYRTTGTAGAAAVAEGAPKPTSDISYDAITVKAAKLAHVVECTEESLSDFPSFQQLLSQDLIFGLVDAENGELLNANGVAPHTFGGLLQTSGILTYTQALDESSLDAVESAVTALRVGPRFADADGMIMSPQDYSAARRAKSTGSGDYLAGNPTQAGPRQLWGVPVVLTTTIAPKTALVGNFAQSCLAWIRQAASIRVDPYSQSTSNKVLLIAEERLALGVLAPAALVKVTLT